MNDELRQRDPALSDEPYLAALRKLPCVVCGRTGPSDAGHIRMSGVEWGYPEKRATGMQEKPSDRWALPMCKPSYRPDDVAKILKPDKKRKLVDIGCHGRQHGHDKSFCDNEEQFWRKVGKNPFQIADLLYKKFGTVESERKSKYRKPRKRAPRTTIVPKGFGEPRKMASRLFPTTKRKMRP
jgi:hypothetical protein